jgi:hypothetical protein
MVLYCCEGEYGELGSVQVCLSCGNNLTETPVIRRLSQAAEDQRKVAQSGISIEDFTVEMKLGVNDRSGYLYQPAGQRDLLDGNDFDSILAGQHSVSTVIVEDKKKLLQESGQVPIVQVAFQGDQPVLKDAHHTFVAAMALGKPIMLVVNKKRPGYLEKSYRWKTVEKGKFTYTAGKVQGTNWYDPSSSSKG